MVTVNVAANRGTSKLMIEAWTEDEAVFDFPPLPLSVGVLAALLALVVAEDPAALLVVPVGDASLEVEDVGIESSISKPRERATKSLGDNSGGMPASVLLLEDWKSGSAASRFVVGSIWMKLPSPLVVSPL